MTEMENKAVGYTVQQGVATITMQSAPVNALSRAVRVGLIDGIESALSDDSVSAIVITSSLALFSGGADISEFSGGDLSPNLPEVLDKIENATKPVVAVLPGPAFGGGLEVALACHHRITFAGNQVGLPEVNLGILPGAGGTQRLPRLADPATALTMIVTGKPTSVVKLSGVFDKISDKPEHLLEDTKQYLGSLNAENGIKRTSDITLTMSEEVQGVFDAVTAQTKKAARGFFAPLKCIEAVKGAYTLAFSDGLKHEGKLFMECMNTPQARAQQHFFFAERAAGHVSDFDKSTPERSIEKVAVIGAGTMGGGIAMNFANAGIPVTMLELKQEALDKGLALIRKNYENSAKKGKLTQEQVETRMALLSGTTTYDDLADVDLVIEAVFEKMEVKKTVFTTLDKVCKPGAILASNTSTLDVNEIAACTSRPQDVIGLHFFSPANVMKLLEVVKAEDTSADVIKTCMKLAKRIKKVAVLVGVCFGFVGNRMIEPYGREANRLLLEGASPEQVDRVLTQFGMPMGPFTMGDMAGLDIGYYVRQSRQAFISHDPSYGAVADRLVEKDRNGLKTGRGAYLYEAGSRVPIPDPEVLEIAKQEAARLGVAQRDDISDEEILVRCLYTLINEGACILEEGIAAKSSDIDVIYVYGYGFPVYRGGPMQYADEVGLGEIVDKLSTYAERLGDYGKMWLQPSDLLIKLAQERSSFAKFKN
ncbi:3-hydroxyacyl-CoA dehydrogenase NAD-binding domain-containing protein [Alteromonas stellipolaris]|jgi:3-hydroxyacyl-CoA dehydrogenase|uniref:3-hydroxyacyl-CoA dehydrogenase NAD-binding domain-containing protein n=1 Tax=Alteromonas stellipolaris TaxID=233316 RepID=UPI0026E1366A|nr:3-hydroxyacyl-CoA dehydrogenase NAD-binding domain-containing protein [Alteromonas stellipolaris]MDO6536868.1 3-hydroxyacyl-CoA dehydrogenase NAD-binding domain-containing protein [Alteromonas stellipolaris]MDO6628196.1 3-hydroxyacyl-CoA dehydrogenase NAD-binding domain-containing protein [Alteromonas stellipolaris]MDP2598136.1 3-hydroxyacyl-CoA dehydrogenase NAD-binding domain-containing protein [Alteromonas stellipolaris]